MKALPIVAMSARPADSAEVLPCTRESSFEYFCEQVKILATEFRIKPVTGSTKSTEDRWTPAIDRWVDVPMNDGRGHTRHPVWVLLGKANINGAPTARYIQDEGSLVRDTRSVAVSPKGVLLVIHDLMISTKGNGVVYKDTTSYGNEEVDAELIFGRMERCPSAERQQVDRLIEANRTRIAELAVINPELASDGHDLVTKEVFYQRRRRVRKSKRS